MFVESDNTTAILDAPFPDYIQQMQSTLRLGASVLVTANVNGTVSENIDLDPSTQSDFS